MRHPTVLLFWALIAAVIVWAGAAALAPQPAPWLDRRGVIGLGPIFAGPSVWDRMHSWGGGPYIIGAGGAAPQIADVEQAMNQWLAALGNPRLKLGPVTEKNATALQADILTKDGSLVQRFEIDRRDGQITSAEN